MNNFAHVLSRFDFYSAGITGFFFPYSPLYSKWKNCHREALPACLCVRQHGHCAMRSLPAKKINWICWDCEWDAFTHQGRGECPSKDFSVSDQQVSSQSL